MRYMCSGSTPDMLRLVPPEPPVDDVPTSLIGSWDRENYNVIQLLHEPLWNPLTYAVLVPSTKSIWFLQFSPMPVYLAVYPCPSGAPTGPSSV